MVRVNVISPIIGRRWRAEGLRASKLHIPQRKTTS